MKIIISMLLAVVSTVLSQDFGYEHFMLTEYRSIGLSYTVQNFSSLPSNPLSDSIRTSFSTDLPFIEYRQDGGRFALGYQTFTDINGRSRESFSVYGESQNDIPLGGSRTAKATFFIPISVGANYIRAQSPSTAVSSFDVGSLGVGTGIKYKLIGRSLGVQAYAVGSLYYASEGFSTEYGSQTSVVGEVQLMFSELLYYGMLVGYRYESQQWNMTDNRLDYKRYYHGAFVGILF